MAVDWLISSRTWTTQTITISGTPEDVTAAAGGLYLIHPTASLSLLARVVVAMAAAGVADAAAYVTEDRHVRLTSSATFSITWGTGTTLRDLLGFDANLSGATSYTAPAISTLLYSVGKYWTPERSPLDTRGQPVADITATFGPNGRQVVRQEGTASLVQVWSARYIERARFWAADTAVAGELRHFWENELITNQRLIVLRRVGEGTSTTASADYGSSTALGPYRADLTDRTLHSFDFKRESGYERVEAYYGFRIPAVVCEEFSA